MLIVVLFIAVWFLSLFSQSFFHHRYASHGAFKMSRFWERFFFVFTYVTQGAHYMSPGAYAIMHRMHHAYTDTEKDPHSPNFSSNLFSMMWRTRQFYVNVYRKNFPIELKFTKNLPEWKWFDNWANSNASRLIWSGIYIALFAMFATSPWLFLLLPVVLVMGAFHGAIINWFAHKVGYKNYKLKNTSVNLFAVDILMLGESLHNNHHKYPSAVNFAVKWHEIDPVYPIILFLNWIHVIRIPKLSIVHPHE